MLHHSVVGAEDAVVGAEDQTLQEWGAPSVVGRDARDAGFVPHSFRVATRGSRDAGKTTQNIDTPWRA